MRVTGGRLRGRTLEAPGGSRVRPTYDRVRESVFAILGPAIDDAHVLDLFAGTGTLAIESVSRGARSATLVEIDRRAMSSASRNIERLGVVDECRLRRCDALGFLARDAAGDAYDVVFVDPPYESGLQERALERLASWGGLSPGAVVVVERAFGRSLAPSYGRLVRTRTERYGSTEVDMYVLGARPRKPVRTGKADEPDCKEVA